MSKILFANICNAVIPAQAGIQRGVSTTLKLTVYMDFRRRRGFGWIPAYAGMTTRIGTDPKGKKETL